MKIESHGRWLSSSYLFALWWRTHCCSFLQCWLTDALLLLLFSVVHHGNIEARDFQIVGERTVYNSECEGIVIDILPAASSGPYMLGVDYLGN